jgi:murein DD-endopeptidase MepM/ murein hydrolase activator NlpD
LLNLEQNKRNNNGNITTKGFGEEDPITLFDDMRKPDRRQISVRWLASGILAVSISTLLMGGALYAALDGREKLAQPALKYYQSDRQNTSSKVEKGNRVNTALSDIPSSKKIVKASILIQEDGQNVIKQKPFGYASAPLAVSYKPRNKYPAFNALSIFSASKNDNKDNETQQFYGADVEDDVSIQTVKFPENSNDFDTSSNLKTSDVEELVRSLAPEIADGDIKRAALPYFDPARFDIDPNAERIVAGYGIRITDANVSEINKSDLLYQSKFIFEETLIRLDSKRTILEHLNEIEQSDRNNLIVEAIENETGKLSKRGNHILRVSYQKTQQTGEKTIQRVALYKGANHMVSIGIRGDNSIRYVARPTSLKEIAELASEPGALPTVSKANLPSIYDGLYRAGMSQNLQVSQIKKLIKVLASSVDFQRRSAVGDKLELFYTLEDGAEIPTDKSDILYAAITLNGQTYKYYRFQDSKTGQFNYYDENGKSANKFLLRKPVPTGKLRSGFGRRRHPILRYYKMHWGVDWAAKRGTPILAAGNGTIEKAGWAGGYGRQTIIRHANGYKTSYNHQSKIKVKKGQRVRQGQVIGSIGSTGQSTGPHLHYEVIVNGKKVNPLKIRLPKSSSLTGAALSNFKEMRDSIDELLQKANSNTIALN